MNVRWKHSIVPCLILTLASPTLASTISLGQKLSGKIVAAAEIDHWDFHVVAGAKISATCTGKNGLKPEIELVSLPGEAIVDVSNAISGIGTSKVKLTKFSIPDTGKYRFRIRGGADSIGAYTVTTSATWPKSFLSASFTSGALGAGETATVPFLAIPGARLSLSIENESSSNEAPAIATILAPNDVVDFTNHVSVKKNVVRVKNLKVASFGSHTITFAIEDGGVAKTKVTLEPPKPKGKSKHVFEGEQPLINDAVAGVIDSVADPGAAIASFSRSVGELYATTSDPAALHEEVRAAILSSLKEPEDVLALEAASASASPLLTITQSGSGNGAGTAAGSAAQLCDPAVTVFYINGVLTSYLDAANTAHSIDTYMQSALAGTSVDAQIKLFYNQSGLTAGDLDPICGSLMDWILSNATDVPLIDFISPVLIPAAEAFEAVCQALGQSTVVAVATDLLLRSPAQWVTQYLVPSISLPQAALFREIIRQHLLSGRRVVVIAHSQGNFYTREALSGLSPSELASVGVVAVASPTSYPGNGTYGSFVSVKLMHDIIGLVPGSPPSNTTNALSAEPYCDWSVSQPIFVPVCAIQAYLVHGIGNSYLKYSSSRNPIIFGAAIAAQSLPAPTTSLGQGFFQVTLTWNTPGDIDLHVFEPMGTHVYWASKIGTVGELDYDDIYGTGPENYFVCKQSKMVPGTYSIFVNNYGGATGTSGVVWVTGGDKVEFYSFIVGEANGGDLLVPIEQVHYGSNGQFSLPPSH